jgi:hypothetical protein
VSSTSIRSWTEVPVSAWTVSTSPISHWIRSTLWIAWFISAPPPSSSQVPRQPPES